MQYIRFGHRGSDAEVLRAIETNKIPHAMRLRHWYRQVVTVGDFVGEGDTDQTLTLNALYPRNTFPTDVDLLEGACIVNRTLPVGTSLTAATLRLGGVFAAGTDDDGLLTVSNWLGSGAAVGDVLNTPSAANYANRYEAAFSPQVRMVATGANWSAATAGAFEVFIPWTPRPQRSS
jgi:roadblock/LC7 domain-containing protein